MEDTSGELPMPLGDRFCAWPAACRVVGLMRRNKCGNEYLAPALLLAAFVTPLVDRTSSVGPKAGLLYLWLGHSIWAIIACGGGNPVSFSLPWIRICVSTK